MAAGEPVSDLVLKTHIESAEQFHEDIRDFDELMQAGASRTLNPAKDGASPKGKETSV